MIRNYTRRIDNNKLLKLKDKDIFDKNLLFKLNSHDTHRVLVHTGAIKREKVKLSPTERRKVGTKPTDTFVFMLCSMLLYDKVLKKSTFFQKNCYYYTK